MHQTAVEVISADDNDLYLEPLLTDDQITYNIIDEETVDGVMNYASEKPTYPKATDVRHALEVLHEHMLRSAKGGEIQGSLNRISGTVEDKISVISKQREPSFSEKNIVSCILFISV